MIESKNKILIAFISLFSWFLMVSGILVHLNDVISFLYVFILLLITFFLIYNTCPKGNYLGKELYSDRITYKIIPFVIILVFISFIYPLCKIVIEYNFNLQYVRNFYFSPEGKSSIFGNNKYISMIYNYMVMAFFWAYLFSKEKFTKIDYTMMFLFFIVGVITGGRFNGYKLIIFFTLRSLIFVNLNKASFFKRFIFILTILGLVGISLNRVMLSYHLDFVDAFERVVISLYNYHSVQLGIYNEFIKTNNTTFLGPMTGIVTPVYTIFMQTSPEGAIGTALNNIEYSSHNYNAFGTSAVFFSSFGSLSFLLYFIFVNIGVILISKIRGNKIKKRFFFFFLFSLYFSAFQPYMFGFSWWLTLICIMLLSSSNPIRIKVLNK